MEIGLEVLCSRSIEMKLDIDAAVQANSATLQTVLDVQKEPDPGVAHLHIAGGTEFEATLVIVVLDADSAITACHRNCLTAGEIDKGQLAKELRRIERLQRNLQGLDSADSGYSRHLQLAPCTFQPGSPKSNAWAIGEPLRMHPVRRPAATRFVIRIPMAIAKGSDHACRRPFSSTRNSGKNHALVHMIRGCFNVGTCLRLL